MRWAWATPRMNKDDEGGGEPTWASSLRSQNEEILSKLANLGSSQKQTDPKDQQEEEPPAEGEPEKIPVPKPPASESSEEEKPKKRGLWDWLL